MPERQHKLERQREKREPRTNLDVRSKPLHADRRAPHRTRPSCSARSDVTI
jgi:hypothetical protein